MDLKQNQKRQREIKNILSRYKSQFLKNKNVKDLAVGYHLEKKHPTNELSIIVEVKNKKITKANDFVFPSELEGIRVDIIESLVPENLFLPSDEIHPDLLKVAQSRNQRFEQLVGGIRIRNARRRNLGGTLGTIVYDPKTKKHYGITCRHVLLASRTISRKKQFPVIQPNQRKSDACQIGFVLKDKNQKMDCIKFELNDKRPIDPDNSVLGIPGKIKGVQEEIICGNKVMKSGARTGVTYGIIISESICQERFIIYPDDDYDLIDGELTLGGDSGAIWILNDGSMKAVGMHALGNKSKQYDEELGVAYNMAPIAKQLGVSF